MPKIKFIKEKKEVEVEVGSNLREAGLAAKADIYPPFNRALNCYGFGLCAKCQVRITKGLENVSPQTTWENLRLSYAPDTWFAKLGHENDLRLSCATIVNGDIEVETQPEPNWHGERFWG